MTIIFFARRFYPLVGGVEKHVYELSKRLIQKGYHVIVITEKTNNFNEHEILKPSGIEVYRIRTGNFEKTKKFIIWNSLWKLKNIIRNADVIHCHDVFFWYLPFRFLYPQKPVYTTFHGYESYPVSKNAIMMRKISEKLSKGNICIGDFIGKWYGTKPTFVSYGAVELPVISKNKNKVKKESSIFIGRLEENTGISLYNKAFLLLRNQFPKFEFGIIGDGKLRKTLSSKSTFLGLQPEPSTYLLQYHFAFVSGYLSMLEAMAAKRLVIAVYNNPLKKDYLVLTPFAKYIIIVKSAEEIAERAKYYLYHSNEETELIEKAYEWVTKQTWNKLVETYLSLWKIK